jgi:hypothetical protein
MNGGLRHADASVGCSEYVTGKIRTALPQYAERCAPLFNGVELKGSLSALGDRGVVGPRGRYSSDVYFLRRALMCLSTHSNGY